MTDTTSTRRAGPDAGGTPPGTSGPAPRRWLTLALLLLAVVLGGGAFAGVVALRHSTQPAVITIRPSSLPADVPTSLADVMSLSTVPRQQAPAFSLTDQHGHRWSLSSLRGKAVVLEFMDPHCTDICPLVSQEFVDAFHDLGRASAHVAFVAVNVNPYFTRPADVAAFSREHGLDGIPSWRFVTGPVPALRRVWHAYGITVEARGRNADVVHSSQIYFIAPDGTERYVAAPDAMHTATGRSYLPAGQLASWGRGIALVARDLTR